MEDREKNNALNVITKKIADLMNKYAIIKNSEESQKLKERINILQNTKDEIYKGNDNIIKKVLEKEKRGIL